MRVLQRLENLFRFPSVEGAPSTDGEAKDEGQHLPARFAALALMAAPLFVALYLPPQGSLPIGQALIELKMLALRWTYAVCCATLGALFLLQLPLEWSFGQWRQRFAKRADLVPLALLIALLAWALIALVASRAPVLSWRESAPIFFPATLTLLIGLGGLHLPLLRILLFASLGGVLVALVALLQVAGVNLYHFAYDLDVIFNAASDRGRLIASLGNAEYLGGYLAAMGAIHFGLFIGVLLYASIPNRLLWLGVLVAVGLLEGVALLFSGTRSALPALVAGSLWGGFVALSLSGFQIRSLITRQNMGRLSAVLGIFLILILAISPLRNQARRLIIRYSEATNFQSDSIRERSIYSLAANEMLARNPVTGVGPGLYNSSFYITMYEAAQESQSKFTWRRLLSFGSTKGAGNAHNEYAQWGGEMGWPGLALLLGFICSLLLLPWTGGRGGPIEGETPLPQISITLVTAAAAGGLMAFFVSALVSFPFRTPGRAALLWLLIALVMAAARSNQVTNCTKST